MVTIIDLNQHLKKLNGILKKEKKEVVEEKPAPKKRGRPAKKKEK